MKLKKEEQRIVDEVTKGHYTSMGQTEVVRLTNIVKNTQKESRINIRLVESDIEMIKNKALREGIPYQTLIKSILHKYINDKLIDLDDVKKIKELIKTA